MHSGGVTSLDFDDLPESLQKRYHYDVEKAAAAKTQRTAEEKRAAEERDAAVQQAAAARRAAAADPGGRAFEAMRSGNLEEAHRWLDAATRSGPRRELYSEVDSHISAILDALKNYSFAQQDLQRLAPELDRIRRNAAVADRPNVLFPNDNSNQIRARDMRKKAEQMQQDAQRQIEESKKEIENELQLVDTVATKQKTVGAYTVALDLTEMIENVAEHLPRRSFHPSIDKGEQAMLRQHVAAASRQLQVARVAADRKQLWAAHQAIEQGLHEEPGLYELQALSDQVRAGLDGCARATGQAIALKAKKQYEQSLEKVRAAETECVDQPDTERLSNELKITIAEKEQRLAKARADEDAGDFESALRIYDTYAQDEAVSRVTPKLAKLKEDRGDFLAAYALYQRANMPADMQRIGQLREEQAAAYKQTKTLVAQAKFDEAAAIFDRYRDVPAKNDVLIQKAAFLEGEQKFDEAIAAYSAAGASFEVARVRSFITDHQKLLVDAANQERAANYDAALELFTKANSKPDIGRVAGTMAREFERKQDYESAAQYFETAGLYDEAGRIRKTHDLAKSSARRTLSDTEIFKKCAPACVTVLSETPEGRSQGSGFFVTRQGHVLTNHHVVDGAQYVQVVTSTNRTLEAHVVAQSETPDLALLQTGIRDSPALEVADSDQVETGAHVAAIGTPKDLAQSFTTGNISNANRLWNGNSCFQISVLINHGNSGGPLLDDKGRVVAVNTAGEGTLGILRDTGVRIGSDLQGINYAIKINEAKHLLGEIHR
jgi:S1-C subfamily serine protease